MEKYLPYVALALSILSLVLHKLAPLTKTKADDVAAEVVDAVKDTLPKSPAKPK